MKPHLGMNVSQGIALTPQLVQSIRLLQLSAPELEQQVREALETNPMLEPVDDEPRDGGVEVNAELMQAPDDATPIEIDWDAALAESWEAVPAPRPAPSDAAERPAPDTPSVHRRRLAELEMLLNGPREAQLATALLDAIDDNGYLEQSLAQIAEALPDTTEAELEAVLAKVQQLDPPGFGARNLAECLALQLQAMPSATRGRDLALWLARNALDAVAAGDVMACDENLAPAPQLLAPAFALIQNLNPKPAAAEHNPTEYVTPDLILRRNGREWILELNRRGMPRIRVNQMYARLLDRCRDDAAALRRQLSEARWLVRGLEMREDTLLRAGRAIFDRQRDFLEHGDEGIKPLTLKEVATAIGMHESTISRITAKKYVLTPAGLFELRHFFSSTLTARQGQEASGAAVRATIRRMIGEEDPARPLSDGDLQLMLSRKGVQLARRTVAKYREALRIAPARGRTRKIATPILETFHG